MKTSDEQKINIIKKVMICNNAQLTKVNEYISLLWDQEEQDEQQSKKEFEQWKADRPEGATHPYENWRKNL